LGKPVYISADNSEVFQELASALNTQAERVQRACYGSCENDDLPEKSCNENVIVWTKNETNRVYVKDSCVFIEGDTRAVEAFLYRFFGLN
jgi:hypothetical protein